MKVRIIPILGSILLGSLIAVPPSLAAPEQNGPAHAQQSPAMVPDSDAPKGKQSVSKEQQRKVTVAQRVIFRDNLNNIITVVTYSDGTYKVFINRDPSLTGTQAATALSSRGIEIDISSSGEILSYNLTQNTVVEQAPQKVTPKDTDLGKIDGETRDSQTTESEQGRYSSRTSLPVNIVTGHSYITTINIGSGDFGIADGTERVDTNANGRPISR